MLLVSVRELLARELMGVLKARGIACGGAAELLISCVLRIIWLCEVRTAWALCHTVPNTKADRVLGRRATFCCFCLLDILAYDYKIRVSRAGKGASWQGPDNGHVRQREFPFVLSQLYSKQAREVGQLVDTHGGIA